MRRPTLFLAMLALVSLQFCKIARADETSSAMADAAKRFLAALDDKQKAQASFSFDSPERFNWHWIPRERKGLPIKAMTPEQRALAFGLLDTGLSTKGMLKATTIMSLEEILRVKEQGTGPVRDPELYFVSIFGNPAENAEWGWRIEGHHLALNYTLRDGRVVSATPFMFGSNPATVKDGGRKGLRNLASIEEPANQLLLSLNDEQRRSAIVSAEVPDVTTTPNSAQRPPAPRSESRAPSSMTTSARCSTSFSQPTMKTSPSPFEPHSMNSSRAASANSISPGTARPTRPSPMRFAFKGPSS